MFTENEPKKEETPEVLPEEETPEVEKQPKEESPGGADNQTEELNNLKKESADKDALLAKRDKEINQQRFTMTKMDKKLAKAKEDGFVDDEPSSGISEERVAEIVADSNKPLLDAITKMGTTISENARTQISKDNLSPGGGPGQKKPVPPKEPVLPKQAQDMVKRHKLEWTGKGYQYKSPTTGIIHDLEDDSDIK